MDLFDDSMLQTKEGVMVADKGGKILMMNHSFEVMWKISESTTTLSEMDEMIHFMGKQARDPLLIIKSGSRILGAKNAILRGDFTLKDGRVFNIHTFPMIGADNKIYGRVWYTHDVTEEKRIEDLRNLHGLIMENLDVGVILTQASTSKIVYANKFFEKIFGYERNELLGKRDSVLNAQTEKTPEEVDQEIVENLRKIGRWSGVLKNVKKDGTQFYTKVKIKEIQSSEYGKIWVSIQSDITHQLEVERDLGNKTSELQESEALYETLFESAEDPVVIWDPTNWKVVKANKAALRRLQLSSLEEMKSLGGPEMFSPGNQPGGEDRQEKVKKAGIEAMKNGESEIVWQHRMKDGSEYPVKVKLTRVNVGKKVYLQANIKRF